MQTGLENGFAIQWRSRVELKCVIAKYKEAVLFFLFSYLAGQVLFGKVQQRTRNIITMRFIQSQRYPNVGLRFQQKPNSCAWTHQNV